MRLILGSRSEGRKRVLQKMGHKLFGVVPAEINERAIRHKDPVKLVTKLAHAKANAIRSRLPVHRAILITSDQVVLYNNVIREKPVDESEAFVFLLTAHKYPLRTVTSVVVTNLFGGQRLWGVDQAEIRFTQIPVEVAELYIDMGYGYEHSGGFDQYNHLLKKYYENFYCDIGNVYGLTVNMTRRFLDVFLGDVNKVFTEQ